MKNLAEIYEELDARKTPSELGELTSYAQELQRAGSGAAAKIAILIAKAKRTIFKDAEGFHAWAEEKLAFNSNHTSHCAKIGAMLLDIEDASFKSLASLSFDKLLPLSRLEPVQLSSLLSKEKLEELSRDEIRVKVCETLGEESKGSVITIEAKDKNAISIVQEAASLNLEDLHKIIASASASDTEALLKGGRNLLAAGIEAAQIKGQAKALENVEKLLASMLKDIREGRQRLASPAEIPNTEKTA